VPVFSLYKEWKDRGGWYFLNPINSFWLTFIYVGVIQTGLARNEWIAFYGEETVLAVLAMFLVLGLGIHMGYHSEHGPKWETKLPTLPAPDAKKVLWASLILLGIGFLGYHLVAQSSGGWQKWISSPRRYTEYTLSGYIYTMPRVATLGIMVLLCYAFFQDGKPLLKLSAAALGLLNTFWQVYTGTREGTIVMLVIMLGSIYGSRRRNPPIVGLLGVLVLVFFLFGFIPSYRSNFSNLSFNIQETPEQVLERSMAFYENTEEKPGPNLWSDFGMAISVAYYVPSRADFDYGQMFLEVFTRPIPRFIWPDKIYPEGEAWDRFHQVAQVSDVINAAGLRSGPSPTMVGKYYYAFGWPGLALGGYLTGICFRVLWEFLQRHSHLVTGVILAVATAGLGAMEMIHPLSWSINFWLPTIGFPFFVMCYLMRQRETPPQAVTPRFSSSH
jgi:oligosaccharide repeat unit polymerase